MDTFESSLSSSFNLLCGPRVFTARDNSNNAVLGGWAAITPHPSSPNKAILTIDPSKYGQLITTAVTKTVKVAVTLQDYSNRAGVSDTLTVSMQPIACNCADMLWNQPDAVTLTVAVNANASIQIPEPTSDNSQAADEVNHRAFANCFKSGGPGCTVSGGTFPSANIFYSSGVVTKPSLITDSLPSAWLSFINSNFSGEIVAAPNNIS